MYRKKRGETSKGKGREREDFGGKSVDVDKGRKEGRKDEGREGRNVEGVGRRVVEEQRTEGKRRKQGQDREGEDTLRFDKQAGGRDTGRAQE